jgi:hypothetical protein
MRVARYQGEKNLADVAKRVYRLGAAGAPSAAEAAAALADANEHLALGERALPKRVERGTLIAVPELDDAFDGRSALPRNTVAAQILRVRGLAVLERVKDEAELRDAREAADIDALEATFASDEFAELVGGNEDLRKKADAIRGSIDERRALLESLRSQRADALGEARARIEELASRLGGTSPAHPEIAKTKG